MAAVSQDIEIWQGETKDFDFYVTDDNGAAIALTNGIASFEAWNPNGTVLLKSTISGMSIVNGNATNDAVRLSLAKSDSENIPTGVYVHECRVSQDGDEIIIATGMLVVNESKTR